MQTINISPTTSILDDNKPPKLILLKGIAVASVTVSLIGGVIHVVDGSQAITKADPKEQIKPGDGRRELTTPIKPLTGDTAKGEDKQSLPQQTQPSEAPVIITKKPEKPIILEEGSEAWFCLQNNGGSGCLGRSRTAPNYRVVEQQKYYNDYLIEYGIKPINNCPPEIAWQPNCQ